MERVFKILSVLGLIVLAVSLYFIWYLTQFAHLAPFSTVPERLDQLGSSLGEILVSYVLIGLNILFIALVFAKPKLMKPKLVRAGAGIVCIVALGILGLPENARDDREVFWSSFVIDHHDTAPAAAGCHNAETGLARCSVTCMDSQNTVCELAFVGSKRAVWFSKPRPCGIGILRARDLKPEDIEQVLKKLLNDQKLSLNKVLSINATEAVLDYCL